MAAHGYIIAKHVSKMGMSTHKPTHTYAMEGLGGRKRGRGTTRHTQPVKPRHKHKMPPAGIQHREHPPAKKSNKTEANTAPSAPKSDRKIDARPFTDGIV